MSPKILLYKLFNTYHRGVSIYLALVILSILLSVVLGVATILFGQMKTLTSIGHSVISFYAVDTAIERELYFKNYQSQPAGYSYAGFLDLDSQGVGDQSIGSCPAGLTDPGDTCYQLTISSISPIVIKAFGYYRDVRRALEISF